MSDTPASSDPAAPEQGSRVVRVFISSTFRDFGSERDLLMKRVFPELRRRARDRFVEILGVDLRWGITEEQSEQGETLPVCLREIERSRPYFVGFLGQRYGWTPAANLYPELLLAQQPWLAQHAGGASVTELEILHGVLNAPEMAGRAFFYFRDPSYAQGKGADFASEGDEERSRLALLKDRIRSSPFPVVEYATPEEAADRITEALWRMIDAEYPADEVPDELERTRRSHDAYAAPRRRMYIGQEATLAEFLARMEQASQEAGEDGSRTRMTLVTAESGTGKSALLANGLAAYRQAHPDHPVIEHYTASSGEAADHLQLVKRVCEHIKRLVGSGREIESDAQKLIEQFPEWIAEASFWARKRGMQVILAVDALDRLGEHRWLPRSIPPHVHLVASTVPGVGVDAMLERGAGEVVALPFTPEVARQFVVQTLQKHGRQLPARELDRIMAHPRATLPIWLKTLVDELSVHGSHEGLSARITECLQAAEPDDLFEVILARLEADLGRDTVQKPMEAIRASADGMSEDELMRFTSVSPLELAQLRLALDDALFEAGGRLHLVHAFVRKGVRDRYLPTGDERMAMHRRLGLWWEQQDPTPRMANELVFQMFGAKAWDDLLRCLIAPRTGTAMVQWVNHLDLYKCWQAIAAQHGTQGVALMLESAFTDAWPIWLEHWKRADDPAQAMVCCHAMTAFCRYAGLTRGVALDAAQQALGLARGLQARSPTPQSLRVVSWSLRDVAEIEESRGSLDSALAKYGESLGIFRQLAEQLGTPESLRDVSISLGEVADIERSRGSLDSALTKYEECLRIARQLAEQLGNPESLRNLSISLNGVAIHEKDAGKWDAALAKFEESLLIRRQLLQQLGSVQSLSDVGGSLANVASVEESRGNWDAALAKFEESLGIARQLAEQLRNPESLRDLSRGLDRVADIERNRGDRDSALAKYEESLRIARQLAEQLQNPQSLRDVSLSLDKVGDIETSRGSWDSALAKYEESLVIRRQLAEQLGIPQSLDDVTVSLGKVASIEQSRGNWDAALTKLEESLGINRQLAKQLGNPRSLGNVRYCLSKVAEIEQSRGDLDAALAKFEESLGIARQLAEQLGGPQSLHDLSVSLSKVAAIEQALGDLDAALAKYEESLRIARLLAEQLGDPRSLGLLGTILLMVGNLQRARGNWDAALAKYEESLGIYRPLAEQLGTPESLRSFNVSLLMAGDIDERRGDLDAALAKYEESLRIFRQLAEQLEDPQSLRDVSVSLVRVAAIEVARGNWESALAKYQESLGIARQLAAQLGNPESLRDVGGSLACIADIEAARGNLDAALAKYQESLRIASQLYAQRTAEGDLVACDWLVWLAHLTAACLNAMDRSPEALNLLQMHADDVAKLEAECGDNKSQLDTCAEFYETFAAVCSATKDAGTASAHAARAAGIRARIKRAQDGTD